MIAKTVHAAALAAVRAAVAPALAAVALAGCATAYASPVEVTRFVGDAPARLGSGTIAIRPAAGTTGGTLEFAAYEQAVAAELTRLGYQVTQGTTAQVAELRIGREGMIVSSSRRPKAAVEVGAQAGNYGSGLGLGIGIDLSGPRKPVIANELGVTIRDSANRQSLWEGRASFGASSDSASAQVPAAATRLATALFGGFPGKSGQTITVK
ncbi:MAG: hypothetical protein RLZZ08_1195 [Pseudomonadota bacterium]|jgi:hypothetical protein